ncbi:unnamed protein product [Linum tenue]|uniref:DEAH11/12 type I KH-domain domain-containing protein n=1 Tax=Linum tenue TaxID=586396 RepID=A0AAV0NPM3_9ROSI|nr:unnamed protein product [Linum tenue]
MPRCMKASIIFDGRLHLEAAKALEYLQGKVLSVCLPWQKIRSGVEYKLEEVANASWRVELFANATKTVVELRRPLEKLMRGRTINHESLTQSSLS